MEKQKQVRKKSPKNGVTQKRINFVCDFEVYNFLADEPNKSRLINDLLRQHYGILPDEQE